MVKIPEVTPENTEVDTGRRDFLIQSLTGGAALAAMGVLGTGLTGCTNQTDTAKKTEEAEIQPPLIEMEIKDFETSIHFATENLLDAYEILEFNIAKKYYTDNYNNVDVNKLINLSIMLMHLRNVGIPDNSMQKRMDNMLFKFVHEKHGNHSTIEMGLLHSSDILAKKYPDLIPVIEKWKKR